MKTSKSLLPDQKANAGRDIFARWAWAILILLLVAVFSIGQIDLYLPTHDEFFSMFNSGWLVNQPYSPVEVIQSLQKHSPNHTPGYFLLLSAWGNLTTFEVALGRVLTIYCALLSLAISYRILYDFVSPVAGLFALVILASNAFFNFYIPHVRMYPLTLFLAGVVLWLYLRILYQVKSPNRGDFAALLLAIYALVNVHPFSAIFFISLGIYHLLFVRKDRIWWKVSSAAVAAFILFSPYIMVLTSRGVDHTVAYWGDQSINGWEALSIWLTVFSNNQPMLLLLSVVGVIIGLRKNKLVFKPYFLLIALYLLVLCIFAEITPFVAESGMRHQFPAWHALALVVSAGLYVFYCMRRWLGILLLIWVVAGVLFQMTANWKNLLAGRIVAFGEPAWHAISREFSPAEAQYLLIGYRLSTYRIDIPTHIDYPQREYFIDKNNIDLRVINELAALDEVIHSHAITSPEFWVIYQTNITEADEAAEIQTVASAWQYAPCETLEFGINTVMQRYRWQTLNCEPSPESLSKQNELLDYKFHAARVDSAGSRVFFVDEWTARSDDSLDSYNMSFQLISQDWDNVVQLDLPMVHEDMLRQFSIEVGAVPRGSYRLMAIVYDKLSGRRLAWNDSGADPPEFLPLADVVLE
ncbi:MAG: hypothetical protein OXG39_08105 [Chloroflexi bacterium]|nr:hypothetical protein [Chloroflexota bacterium]